MKINLYLLIVLSLWVTLLLSLGQQAVAQHKVENKQTTSATVYQVKQKDGSILYTDSPTPTARPLEFDAQTQNMVSAIPVPPVPIKQPQINLKYQVKIVSPKPSATIRNNLGDITIRAQQPSSPKAPRYRLIFDGAPLQSNTTGVFSLSGINRGAHEFKVELTDNKGKTLASTEVQTLFLHKASVLINQN